MIREQQKKEVVRAGGRKTGQESNRRLQAVEARRPCVVTWARPRAHVIRPKTEPRRARTPIRHNDPPVAAPPATRYRTGSSKRERPIESAATDTELAGSSKTWHIGGQIRHTRGPQGSLPFRRIRRRRPGTSHEAARTTTTDMAPPRSPAAADDHPAASWGGI